MSGAPESAAGRAPAKIRAGRGLLFPGNDQPPLSHFGATLLRHVLTTGLRYSAHQLGLPLFDETPVTIVRLRVYLDRAKLEGSLSGEIGGLLTRALLEPGGAEREPIPAALLGALAFHRTRLRLAKAPAAARGTGSVDASPDELWESFTHQLSRWLPKLNDALLSELLESLDRRRERGIGNPLPPAQSWFAARFTDGRTTRLDALGDPDLRSPSWQTEPVDRGALGEPPLSTDPSRSRGRFREWYRIVLDHLRPIYSAYAESAAARGVLEDPDDAYFFPFGLGHNLTGASAPGWLPAAVASNRSEFRTAYTDPDSPAETLVVDAPKLARLGRTPRWSRAPLAPLA